MGFLGLGGSKADVPSVKATAPTLSDASIESSTRAARDNQTGRRGVGGFSNILTPLSGFSRLGARFAASPLGLAGKKITGN